MSSQPPKLSINRQHCLLSHRVVIFFSHLCLSVFICGWTSSSFAKDYRGNQFIALPKLSKFKSSTDATGAEVLTSPEIKTLIPFDELIASWSAETPDSSGYKIEVRAMYKEHATKFYGMGLWSANPENSPRESVLHQKDE